MREVILSVGIDIGTSTTQLVFSNITIENTASNFSVPRIKIVDKNIIYRSEIYFTPLITQTKIDKDKVREIIEGEYKNAGVKPSDVETGAVIITGETARKENANEVLQSLSGFAGDFVVATAGPDLESIIAGRGAGADKISDEENAYVVNIDIGGGTSNLALFKNGELVDTGCLDIGGRLIKIDKDTKKIYYIYPKIKKLAQSIGVNIEVGDIAEIDKIRKIASAMAEILEEAVCIKQRSSMYDEIQTNKGLKDGYNIEYITFSGGVADYIYNEDYSDPFRFGDMGVVLGEEIKNSNLAKKLKVRTAIETIRATVVGAGSHTTDISGSTITYTSDVFPIKNLPILKLSKEDEDGGFESIERAINEKLKWFNLENESQRVAVALKGIKNPSFDEVQKLSKSLINGMTELLEKEYPIFVIVENDIAKVLGQTMYIQLGKKKNVVCIDSIKVENGDYIDIGKPLINGKVVPVVIKTLVFNS
ncbi:ethanolamine utilization EutA family protein [Clostridium argentinense CDC 2741]|uniref:Ethanolamine utilization EutA family protein n=1 Tax=Clostridium argentinense CDC 2741 TaxID=1418104 RepID=A0A0C1R1J1_9CLOT|nr:ethanolamine ammonia-lyase reactivating factor EutA [Clostridium argentinense]ARC85462.1 ethanolamine ammonia-lyase [Clostridium argentinense]KIE47267.1 ethanolamine utilization EutA family protein [Clostridium argentinense CDC 2741]NFF39974.1 ethanolamine ammonia-lyase reactivating factor EutA [Clostridium argentinense]NFP50329.1 ethanolamine ammonia-lyase reactivating factor EutA [Clostridium argentinense]NFP71970.1 ethanolamine ammonia-lyase reactivating factor EutA [Clostridium argentin